MPTEQESPQDQKNQLKKINGNVNIVKSTKDELMRIEPSPLCCPQKWAIQAERKKNP